MKGSTGITVGRPSALVEGVRGLATRRTAVLLGLAAMGVGILSAGAWISVPFYPVPLTMQTLAVLVVGGLLGPRLGVAAVAGYLALGLSGAPVFHGGTGGVAVLLGPTGGYLVGFLPAAFLMGLAARRSRGASSGRSGVVREMILLAAGALLAEMAIYAVGVPWLAVAYTGGDLGQALSFGAYPYFLGDLLKTAVAIGAVRAGARALGRWEWLPF
jgi:biotin transport system substrate-specific component